MKKCPPDSLDPLDLTQTTQHTVSARLRDPNTSDPISHVFTILPNIDTETCSATPAKPSLHSTCSPPTWPANSRDHTAASRYQSSNWP